MYNGGVRYNDDDDDDDDDGDGYSSEWWRSATEGYPVPVTETKLKSRLRQLTLREGRY